MMIKILTPKILLVLCFFIVASMHSQIEHKIDLGKSEGDIITETVPANEYITIFIKNRLPGQDYSILFDKKVDVPDVLQFPSNKDVIKPNSKKCELFDLIKSLDTLTKEKELAKEIKKIETKIKEIKKEYEKDPKTKKDCSVEDVITAEKLLNDIKKPITRIYKLKKGERLEVTVIRKIDDKSKMVWKYIYTTGVRGKWITTYGFSFITDAFSKEKTYFLDQEDNVFTITKNHREKKLLYVPTVFFTWMPTKKLNTDWSTSLTGGLGFDLESPVVFLGYSCTYNQNISLTIGLSAHNQDFLRGEYKVGDELSSTLSADQLHDKRYVANPFVSLAFRFGSPIFKTASSGAGD